MITRKVKFSNGEKFQVQATTYNEVHEKVIAYMKKQNIKKGYIRCLNRVDSIEQKEGAEHWSHPGFFFNNTGCGLTSKQLNNYFNSAC